MRIRLIKLRLVSILLVVFMTGSNVAPVSVWANTETIYEANSVQEMEAIIYNAIKNREKTLKIKYTGSIDNIMGDVRRARDNAVKKDPYDELNISKISGFKLSKYSDHADISFDSFEYYTTKPHEEFVNQEIERIISETVNNNMNERVKEKAIHNYILNNIEYDQTLEGYTAYSAVNNGRTVCNGYVQLAYRLLNSAGIETKIVKGTFNENGTITNHAWNLVKIDNHWYHLDVTLNDTMGDSDRYYNLTDEDILLDHQFDKTQYPNADSEYLIDTVSNSNSGGSYSIEGELVDELVEGDTVIAKVDSTVLASIIGKADNDTKIHEVEVKNDGEKFRVEIPTNLLEKLRDINPQAIFRVKTKIGQFDLSVALDINRLADELGIDKKELHIKLFMDKLTEVELRNAVQAAKALGTDLDFGLTKFKLELLDQNGKNFEITYAKEYMTRYLSVDQNIDIEKSVIVEYDPRIKGFQPVPGFFKTIDGQKIAAVKQRRNGIYTVLSYQKNFSDINNHWAKENIKKLASKLIVKGKGNNNFNPDDKITRAEFTTLLVRALGLTDKEIDSSLVDISDQWFANSVNVANKMGLVSGYPDGRFGPRDTITRSEMAVLISRAMEFAGKNTVVSDLDKSLASFSDRQEIKAWAKASVAKAAKAKVIRGNNLGEFKPNSDATRAEAVTMLARFLGEAGFSN